MWENILGYLITLLLLAGFGIAILIAILNEFEITRFTTRFTVGTSCTLVGLAFTMAIVASILNTKTHDFVAFLYLAGAVGLSALGFYLLLRK